MQKINKKNVIFLAIILILIIFIIWTFQIKPVESKTLEVEFSVGSTTGINVDTDKLYFGRIVPGSSSQRTINIENGYSFPVKVDVSATKEISPYIYLDKQYIAEPGETTKIPVTLIIPEDMPYGNYSGKIRFDLRKA